MNCRRFVYIDAVVVDDVIVVVVLVLAALELLLILLLLFLMSLVLLWFWGYLLVSLPSLCFLYIVYQLHESPTIK